MMAAQGLTYGERVVVRADSMWGELATVVGREDLRGMVKVRVDRYPATAFDFHARELERCTAPLADRW